MILPHLNLDFVLGFIAGIVVVEWIELFRRARKQYASFRNPMVATVVTKQTPQQVSQASSRGCLLMALLLALPFVALLLLLR
jgi:hypothetical protein